MIKTWPISFRFNLRVLKRVLIICLKTISIQHVKPKREGLILNIFKEIYCIFRII